jgi:predicted DNA-binding protein
MTATHLPCNLGITVAESRSILTQGRHDGVRMADLTSPAWRRPIRPERRHYQRPAQPNGAPRREEDMSDNRKAMTLRLPPEQASALEAVAQVDGVTVAEEVRKAIQERIDALRADPDFQARLRDHLERNQEILRGLAST